MNDLRRKSGKEGDRGPAIKENRLNKERPTALFFDVIASSVFLGGISPICTGTVLYCSTRKSAEYDFAKHC
jgi:hypothetical protein